MDTPPGLEISIADIRLAGHCASGIRTWFVSVGLGDDFKAMIKGGTIPAERFLAPGDPRAVHVVETKMKREGVTNG